MEFRFDAINAFNTPIFAVNGYSTDVFPGDFNKNRSLTDRSGIHRGHPDGRGEYLARSSQPAVRSEVVFLI